jgi:hypothetical protein
MICSGSSMGRSPINTASTSSTLRSQRQPSAKSAFVIRALYKVPF